MKTVKIKVYCKKVEWNGKVFYTYYCKNKNGEYMTVKFTQKCTDAISIPHQNFICEVDNFSANVDRNGKYPCLWVKKCKVITVYDNVNLEDFFE